MKNKKLKTQNAKCCSIIIATGGTGGHICTAIAIAEQLRTMNYELTIVGSKYGIDRTIIPKDYKVMYTAQKPFMGKGVKGTLQFPLFLLLAGMQALYIIKKTKANIVVGTGGFGSFPCVFIAVLLGKPTFITEIDSIPGLTTRVLSRFVKEIWVVFPSAKKRLLSGEPAQKKVKIGNFPIRETILNPCSINQSTITPDLSRGLINSINSKLPTILVFGGSRGALAINKIIAQILGLTPFPNAQCPMPNLLPDFQFIWLTGSKYELSNSPNPQLKLGAGLSNSNVFICDFLKDMGSAYAHSQLAITRAGALTIGELIATHTPAILIPYPYAAKQHQLLNAKFLEKTGGAKVILEKNLTPSILVKEIENLFKNDGEELQKMKKALENLASENGAKQIAKRIIELL